MSSWYIVYNGQNIGPMTKENLLAYHPTRDTLVWKEGMPNWQPLYMVPELMELINGYPSSPNMPPYPGAAMPPQTPFNAVYSGKSKTTAGILALLIGTLGIQYFYVGKVGGGFITILLSLITCGSWGLLTFIQGILMLSMSQQEFDQKYVYSDSTFPLF